MKMAPVHRVDIRLSFKRARAWLCGGGYVAWETSPGMPRQVEGWYGWRRFYFRERNGRWALHWMSWRGEILDPAVAEGSVPGAGVWDRATCLWFCEWVVRG